MNTVLKHKKAISLFLVFASVLFLFLTLFFYVAKVEVPLAKTSDAVNAFNALDGDLDELNNKGLVHWVNAYTIILLVLFAIEFATVAYCLAKKAESKKIFTAIVILNVLLTIVYMINGIAVSNNLEETLGTFVEEYFEEYFEYYEEYLYDGYYPASSLFKTSTSAFVPLILTAVFASGYLALEYLPSLQVAPQQEENAQSASVSEAQAEAAPANATISDEQATELLLKYKQLLDQGVITQEEFDKKKENLLKKSD